MNTDLIVCAAVVNSRQEQNIEQVIKNLSHPQKHKFVNKYILFDGSSLERYTKYKKYIKLNYPDFTIVEYQDCRYYRETLKTFIDDNFEALSENCLVIQDDIVLDDFDLYKLLETKSVFSECKILYFREHRLRLKQWFNILDASGVLIKTHGWNEKVYLITKIDLHKFLGNLLEKEKINYYDDMIKDKCWETITEEEQLEYWKQWGCCEHKTIRHKHLQTKRT